MTRIATTMLCLALTGCVTYGAGYDEGPAELLQSVGDTYVGRPVQDIAARYGAPHSQQDLAGERVYSWHANSTRQWRRPLTSTTTGVVGDASRYPFVDVPYSSTTVTEGYETATYSCRLDVYVRPDGTIRTLGFFGKMGACEQFSLSR